MNKNNMMTNNQYKWSVHLILIQKNYFFFVCWYIKLLVSSMMIHHTMMNIVLNTTLSLNKCLPCDELNSFHSSIFMHSSKQIEMHTRYNLYYASKNDVKKFIN